MHQNSTMNCINVLAGLILVGAQDNFTQGFKQDRGGKGKVLCCVKYGKWSGGSENQRDENEVATENSA